jgi:hypothetical protein
MFKAKKPESYSIEAATAALDSILTKAAQAYVPADRVIDLMESRVARLRQQQATSYSAAPRIYSGNLPG